MLQAEPVLLLGEELLPELGLHAEQVLEAVKLLHVASDALYS